jgi:hypothetical protein
MNRKPVVVPLHAIANKWVLDEAEVVTLFAGAGLFTTTRRIGVELRRRGWRWARWRGRRCLAAIDARELVADISRRNAGPAGFAIVLASALAVPGPGSFVRS